MSRFNFTDSPFDVLSHAEQAQLEACTDIVFFADKSLIQGPEQSIDALYVVIKGVVREMLGDETISLYRENDSFDARAMVVGQTPHHFFVQEEALLYVLPRDVLLALTESNPRFGAYFYAGVSEKMGLLAQSAGNLELQTLLTATVRDVGCHKVEKVQGNLSIKEAAQTMQYHQHKSLFVEDGFGENIRLGILTTTDFRQIIANDVPLSSPISECAQFSLLSIDIDDFLFNALLIMTRKNIRRLVVTEQKKAVGILSQIDVLSYFSNHSHLIAQRLERAQSLDELAEAALQVTRLVEILTQHGVKALQLGRLVQSLNARLFTRAWQLIASEKLFANSCLLVMGSEGRGEQILKTDQDNALILNDDFEISPEELHASCARFSAALADFSYPPCPGKIMLSNPEWCLTVKALHAKIHNWLHEGSGLSLMQLAIFLDAEAICGDASLLNSCIDYLHQRLHDDTQFFSRFALAIEQFDTPLGLFSHLQTKSHAGKLILDLKKGGIFPLVHGLRALALEFGLRANSSQTRLQALKQMGKLEQSMAADIQEALAFFLGLRLKHGLAQLSAGKMIDTLIEPENLSTLERDLLKDSLAVVKKFKALLRNHYRLGSF